MQHTEKYQFKLIDGTDDFSPQPLNDNMELVEDQFQAVEQALDGLGEEVTQGLAGLEDSLDALAANVGAKGKTARIAWGTYQGTGAYGKKAPTALTCDFTPQVVLIQGHHQDGTGHAITVFLLRGATYVKTDWQDAKSISMTWSDYGVSWYSLQDQYGQLNGGACTYAYLILGYEG